MVLHQDQRAEGDSADEVAACTPTLPPTSPPVGCSGQPRAAVRSISSNMKVCQSAPYGRGQRRSHGQLLLIPPPKPRRRAGTADSGGRAVRRLPWGREW